MNNVVYTQRRKAQDYMDRPRGMGMDLVFGYTDHTERTGRYEPPHQQRPVEALE